MTPPCIIILDRDKHHLLADQLFNINLLKPSIIKVVSSDIKEYICGGGYKRILAIIPVNHITRTTSINRTVNEFLKQIRIINRYFSAINRRE